jgi:hypothetical protein
MHGEDLVDVNNLTQRHGKNIGRVFKGKFAKS